eukprot:CAMPEP_0178865982 /NCGR_PEP_ID=MMETSP0747-20121128/4711_1 /TAXON_ID=913974 /ORGANISM="Nitzschia punctata, Strain CCMP561" /LENGTH=214 /DNA_ID=CAMNT_0020532827 /DNA_START=34 /DNA_END=678 /DNA_ORIENTATION=+
MSVENSNHSNKTSNLNQKNKRKQISWYESVTVCVIEGHTSKTWYKESEYAEFKKELRTIQKCICEEKVPSQMFCTRGIEHFVDSSARASKRGRRILAWDTVFRVQEEQWYAEDQHRQNCEDSADALARAYSRVSYESKEDAQNRGLQDECEAAAQYGISHTDKEKDYSLISAAANRAMEVEGKLTSNINSIVSLDSMVHSRPVPRFQTIAARTA